MRVRSNAEWERLYRSLWRKPFLELPREIRAKLVRGCRGKACYDSAEEAVPIISGMKPRPGLYIKAYECPLCFETVTHNGEELRMPVFHIGNSRSPNTMPERAIKIR